MQGFHLDNVKARRQELALCLAVLNKSVQHQPAGIQPPPNHPRLVDVRDAYGRLLSSLGEIPCVDPPPQPLLRCIVPRNQTLPTH